MTKQRMTILVGLDSTVVEIFERWLGEYNNLTGDNLTVDELTTWHTHNVHVWGYGPVVMGAVKAKALLKKHGGSYHWFGKTCHVYLKPVAEVVLKSPKVKGIST